MRELKSHNRYVASPSGPEWGEYINIITKTLDQHLTPEFKEAHKIIKFKTYMLFQWTNMAAIRYPGATYGCVEWDDNFIITDVRVDANRSRSIYVEGVNDVLKKFIGMKVIMPHNEKLTARSL